MKKIVLAGALIVLGTIALSSCRKNYNCVANDGTVLSTCNSCKSRGVVKSAFDLDCSLEGGTVVVQ